MKDRWNLWLPVLMMAVFAVTLWPGVMPGNFSAAYALAFCAGIYFPKPLRWILPLATFGTMEIALNLHYGTSIFNSFTLVKLLSYAALIWLGTNFQARNSWFTILGGGLLGALWFYLITNTASWMFDPGYPKTLGGWIQALTTGLPGYPSTWTFFRNTLLSGGLFTGLFAGAMKLSAAAGESEPEEAAAEEGGHEPLPEEA